MLNERRLREQSELALDITERVLLGQEVSERQRQTALAMISQPIKLLAAQNGRDRNLISLIKLGVQDPKHRETLALRVLEGSLPAPDASGGASSKNPYALDAMLHEDAQEHAMPAETSKNGRGGTSTAGARKTEK